MKAYIAIILGILLLAVNGCTPEQEARAREIIGQHRCATFNGYLCSAPDDCALPYLDTIESYCCPINCQTCNQTCEDKNDCTDNSCSKRTNYSCVFTKMHGACQNDEICTRQEIMCNGITTSQPPQIDRVTALNPSGTCRSYSGEGAVEEEASEAGIDGCNIPNQLKGESNKDCPTSCDDGDDSTSDWYDMKTNQCMNTPICDDRDSNTIDWIEKDSNECRHCPKTLPEEPHGDRITPQYLNRTLSDVWTVTALDPDETNNSIDILPPTITTLVINPKTISGSGTVTITLEVTDGSSGFRQGQVWWVNTRGETMTGTTIGESGITSYPYQLEFEITSSMARGTYRVDINLEDKAFNRKYYYGNRDFDGTFEVE